MELCAELSLYPLAGNVDESIFTFIDNLTVTNEITVLTNSVSTQINGKSTNVFGAIEHALEISYKRAGRQVLIEKFILTRAEVSPILSMDRPH